MIEEPDITPEPDYVFKVNGKLDPAAALAEVGGLGYGRRPPRRRGWVLEWPRGRNLGAGPRSSVDRAPDF